MVGPRRPVVPTSPRCGGGFGSAPPPPRAHGTGAPGFWPNRSGAVLAAEAVLAVGAVLGDVLVRVRGLAGVVRGRGARDGLDDRLDLGLELGLDLSLDR